MNRPAIWKIAILSAALGGLSFAGAGTAFADTAHDVAPLSVTTPVPADWPFDDIDDLIRPFPGHVVGLDDDWGDDDWSDDDWGEFDD